MKLTPQQVQKALESSTITYEKEQIKKHDDRCAFHNEPTQDKQKLAYLNIFTKWVGTIIDSKKLSVFNHLLTLPIETVDFMEGVINELKKIFESQNRNISFQFDDAELKQDFQNYLDKIEDRNFWETEGFNTMKSAISSIVVCDMPPLQTDAEGNAQQEGRFPNPYYYFLPIDNVHDLKMDRSKCIEWIVFKDINDAKIIHAFDDEQFASYESKDGKLILLGVAPHDLGYCPARSFWSTPFNKNSFVQKRAPVSNSLGKLDWLLFLTTSLKHTELYAGFPIYVMYEQRCTYEDDAGNACEGGQIKFMMKAGHGGEPQESVKDCPMCGGSSKKDLGAGTILTAPAPSESTDPDLLKGVNVIPAEKESLDYLKERIHQFETSVVINTIGLIREQSKEAMNELQIESGYESRLNVLMDVKTNFEKIHKFVLDTIGRMRYGKSYAGSVVFYGDKFYLYDADDLLKGYSASKLAGTPMFELSSQFDQVVQTRYKNNPEMIDRYAILSEVEPFPLFSILELQSMMNTLKPTPEEMMLKSRFDQLIKRFENEFTNVAMFMPLATREKKIEFISETLKGYIEELTAETTAVAPPAVPPAGTPPVEN